MSASTPVARIDTDAMTLAYRVTAAVAAAFDEVRRQVHQLRGGVPGWAGDPLLVHAVEVLLDEIDAAGLRGQDDAADLADALSAGAGEYGDAESMATYPGWDVDGPTGSS